MDNTKKRIYLTFFIICINLYCYTVVAQSTITGIITDQKGEAANGLSIVAHKQGDTGDILGYAFTGKDGDFKIAISSSEQMVELSTRSLTHRDTTFAINNRSQHITITLPAQVNNIKEVRVKGLPITTSQDTTTYIVNSFEKTSDQAIGDVINRMPGFTVETSGKIAYMGRYIEKYYIEGLDLLGGRYAIANKNLTPRQVAAVEVLHNHQPIKMLRQKQFNEGTSLNIRLKKRYTTTTRGSATAGIPFLKYDLNYSPMVFSTQNQFISTFQTNNIGDDLSIQFNPLVVTDGSIGVKKTELLFNSSIAPVVVSNSSRYLFNHSGLVSINYLQKLNNDKQIKTNIGWYNDWIDERGVTNTELYVDSDTIKLQEKSTLGFDRNRLLTDIIYTNNAHNKYINNKLGIESNWDNSRFDINSEQLQKAKNPYFNINNETDWYASIGKHYTQVRTYFGYNRAPQRMVYTPSVFNEFFDNASNTRTIQEMTKEQLVGNISTGINFIKNSWRFATNFNGQYSFNKLSSNAFNSNINSPDSLRNDLNWHNAEMEIHEQIRYENYKLKLSITIPVTLRYLSIDDRLHTATQDDVNLNFNPRFYINYQPHGFVTISNSISYRNSTGSADNLTNGYIIRNYLNISKQNNKLPHSSNFSINTKFEYKNPLSGWLWAINHTYSRRKNDLTNNLTSIGNGIFVSNAVRHNNSVNMNLLRNELTYFINRWQSSISVNNSLQQNKSDYILNNLVQHRTTKMIQGGGNINIGISQKVIVKHSYNISHIRQATSQINRRSTDQEHNSTIFFYPTKQHWLSMNYEYIKSKSPNTKMDVSFLDFSYSYKPAKQKLSYKLAVRNILNTQSIVRNSYSDISFIEYNNRVRPRELLLTINYSM